MAIPRVIHQLWKDEAIPERYRAFRDSWARLNPGWAQRLWTDRDLLELVETRFPEWLSIYVGYERNISRADLGRYLVLKAHGGVYADLDCECLKPIDPLLGDAGFAIGLEPAEHLPERPGAERFLCPSFIVSAPDHPFWDAVLGEVRASVDAPDVLDQTGPLLLGRAYDGFEAKDSVRLLADTLVYPFSKQACWTGRVHDIEYWEQATRDAFVAHYWDGGWWRTAPAPRGLPSDIPTSVNSAPARADPDPTPRISCLMASRGRLERARPAIEAFLRQTYGNRELVIGVAGPDGALADYVRGLGRPNVRLVALAEPPAPGGAPLHPDLIEAAAGDAVCAWSEDCLHDPRRLEVQQQIRRAAQTAACLMRRRLIWQPGSGRIGVGAARPLADTVLGAKAEMRALAARADSEAAWLQALAGAVRTAAFDLPRLMLRAWPGDDPLDAAAFEAEWQAASTRFPAERASAVLAELADRLAIAAPGQRPGSVPLGPPAASRKILVLTPMKNTRAHMLTYFSLLSRLDPGDARLSIGFLESDSSDGTYEALVAATPALHAGFEAVTVVRHDYGFHPPPPRWAPEIQRRRREILARSRNRLLSAALRDEDWVLWLDADLAHYPADLLSRLISAGRDIVTPYCVWPDGRAYDLNTFRFSPESGGRDDPDCAVDGVFQPPRGHGRLYLDSFQDQTLVEVDGVGGTALLVRGDLHREGLVFPPYSYRGYIETEGLAMMARDMGVASWAMPQLRIVHADA